MSVAEQIPVDGAKLRAAIAAAGLSQRATGAKAGMDTAQVNRLCTGKQRELGREAAGTLARVLGCTADDLRPDPDAQTGGNAGVLMTGGNGVPTLLCLDQLVLTAANPRSGALLDADALAELAESIAAVGVLQNLVVRPLRADDRDGQPIDAPVTAISTGRQFYAVIFGGRRTRAVQLLADDDRWDAAAPLVPCKIVSADDVQTLVLALIENLDRVDLTPIEEAEAFGKLRALDPAAWTAVAIAQRIHRSKRHVNERLALLNLGEAARQALAEGRASLDQAAALATATPALQKEFVRRPTLPDAHSIRLSIKLRQPPLSAAAFPLEAYITKGGLLVDPDPAEAQHAAEKRFADPGLFRELQLEAAKAKQAELLAAGWQWTEFRKSPIPTFEDEGYVASTIKAKAGCILWLDTNGKLMVREGLLKPVKEPAYEEPPAVNSADAEKPSADDADVADDLRESASSADKPDSAALAAKIAADPWIALRLVLLELLNIDVPLAIGWGPGTHAMPWFEKLRAAAAETPDEVAAGVPPTDRILVDRAWAWTATQTSTDLATFLAALCADALEDGTHGDGVDAEAVAPILADLAHHFAPREETPSPPPGERQGEGLPASAGEQPADEDDVLDIPDFLRRRHTATPTAVMVTKDTFPALHAAFEAIECDNGTPIDLETFEVPLAWAPLVPVAEAALARLRAADPKGWEDFVCGEATDMEAVRQRQGDLEEARRLLNDFFDGWPDDRPATPTTEPADAAR